MSVTESTIRTRPKLRRGYRYALTGLLCGFIGLGIATYRMSVDADAPPRPQTKEISDVLSDTVKKTVDKFRKNAVAVSPPVVVEAWTASRKLGLAASVFGFFAMCLGCVSWLVGEHRRWTWAALGVGVVALAWTHVVVAVAIAIGLAVFLLVMSHL